MLEDFRLRHPRSRSVSPVDSPFHIQHHVHDLPEHNYEHWDPEEFFADFEIEPLDLEFLEFEYVEPVDEALVRKGLFGRILAALAGYLQTLLGIFRRGAV
jgi:hypothetical protein